MRLNPLLKLATVACVALALSNFAVVHGSEMCLRTLTTKCEDGKTACTRDCNGFVLDTFEYIEAQDAEEEAEIRPPMDMTDDEYEDARGIAVEYGSSEERLVVESLPKFTRWLSISDIHLSSESPLAIPGSKAKLRNVYLSGPEISSLARATFPNSVKLLSVFQSTLTTLSDLKLPSKLTTLYAADNALTSIARTKFPPTLTTLDLHNNALTSLDSVHFPESLQTLDLSRNDFQRLADVVFPKALEMLSLDGNAHLQEISNVTFPRSTVYLSKCAIRSIRLTQPQWEAFEAAVDSEQVALEARLSSVTQCTTGHFVDNENAATATFTACLLPE